MILSSPSSPPLREVDPAVQRILEETRAEAKASLMTRTPTTLFSNADDADITHRNQNVESKMEDTEYEPLGASSVLRSSNDSLWSRIEGLQVQLSLAKATVDERNKEIRTLRKSLDDSRRMFDGVCGEVNEERQSRKLAEAQRDAAEEDRRFVKESVNQAEGDKRALRSRIEYLEEQLEASKVREKESSKSAAEKSALVESAKKQERAQMTAFELKEKESRRRVAQLEKLLSQGDESVRARDEMIEKLNNALIQADKRLTNTQRELNESERRAVDNEKWTTKQIEDSQHAIAKLSDSVKAAARNETELRRQIGELQALLEDAERIRRRVETEREAATKRLEEAHRGEMDATHKLQGTEKRLAQRDMDTKDLRATEMSLRNEITQLREELERTNSLLLESRSACRDAIQKAERAASRSSTADRREKAVEDKERMLRKRIAMREEAVERLRKDLSSAREDIMAKNEKIVESEKRIGDAELREQKLKQRVVDFQEKHVSLQERLLITEKLNRRLESERNRAKLEAQGRALRMRSSEAVRMIGNQGA